jgi:hypothetical protein
MIKIQLTVFRDFQTITEVPYSGLHIDQLLCMSNPRCLVYAKEGATSLEYAQL